MARPMRTYYPNSPNTKSWKGTVDNDERVLYSNAEEDIISEESGYVGYSYGGLNVTHKTHYRIKEARGGLISIKATAWFTNDTSFWHYLEAWDYAASPAAWVVWATSEPGPPSLKQLTYTEDVDHDDFLRDHKVRIRIRVDDPAVLKNYYSQLVINPKGLRSAMTAMMHDVHHMGRQ